MFLNFGTTSIGLAPALVLLENWRDFLDRIWHYLNDKHTIGNISVSVTALVFGILIFAVALLMSRMLSALLQRRIAKRAYLDPGLQYTLGRLTQYVIVALGSLLALRTGLNLDLTSIALLFTALSVGIGFGLQYIAADIASGFILLFERPVRVGDRITIGEDEGDVQSISLRTTVVTTNNRVSIIVPNSKLVSQRLINWSYGDPRARIAIPIGVSYEASVDLVTETLLKAAESVDNVLKDPPPKVQLLKFGDWSLDFRLLVWTNRPRLHMQIRSDINYRIDKLFREAKIEIPYPQTELRIRQGGSLHIDTDDTVHLQESQSDEPADS
ncbi:MAG TPA: mechanosensitive ion channel domain-containing protein [Pyrinomonadaceae bacterium]|nr:mechanosensitive ion channel domain-containing protein [Pyrinomonadaceae bacterium]